MTIKKTVIRKHTNISTFVIFYFVFKMLISDEWFVSINTSQKISVVDFLLTFLIFYKNFLPTDHIHCSVVVRLDFFM